MPSYKDLQAELQKQATAWEAYEQHVRQRADEFRERLKWYLSVPDEAIIDRRGNEIPYVELGTGAGRSFRACNRFELPFDEETILFTVAVNIEHEGGYDSFFYELSMKIDGNDYSVGVREPVQRFRISKGGGDPDFTEVYESLSRDLLKNLQRRP